MKTSLSGFIMLLGIVLCGPEWAHAYSLTPKAISDDISGLSLAPTVSYNYAQLFLLGKDGNNDSLEWEYVNQRYGMIQSGNYYDGPYDGSSNYLTITISCNGLGSIGSYEAGQMGLILDGEAFNISMPAFTFENQSDYLSLYVADDGSTYWGHHSNGPYYNSGGRIGQLIEDSLTLSPSQAFTAEHLAAIGPPVSVPAASWPAIWVLASGLMGLAAFEENKRRQ